jgi:hypothetical protein
VVSENSNEESNENDGNNSNNSRTSGGDSNYSLNSGKGKNTTLLAYKINDLPPEKDLGLTRYVRIY